MTHRYRQLRRLPDLLFAAVMTTLLLGAPAPALAEMYRLVVGDMLRVSILGDPEQMESKVDLDGALRLPQLGSVQAEGLTIDEIQERLTHEIEETGLHVSPRISVSILEYAPIIVSGAVNLPGRFPFSPTLTARAAAGLAGGAQLPGIETGGPGLQAVQVVGDLREVETEIVGTAIRIARVEAQLEEHDSVVFDPAGLPFEPHDAALLDHLLSREQGILDEDRASTAELHGIRQIELQNYDRQIEILLERSKVQNELIRIQANERAAAEALDERGLRTRMDMARLERNDASLQAQVLDIEAALSQARTRRADLAGTITKTRSDRRLELLADSVKLRAEMEQLLVKRQTVLAKIALLGDPAVIALADGPVTKVIYTIRRRLRGEIETFDMGPDDGILPGDTLEIGFSEPIVPIAAGLASATNRSLN
ncbi:polysaccharide biosynthesis/export family protein [Mangrovicoccus sp. HB161399]|uniref:polysaccharide biosynthesis/export family protein n=1 Tax=Mangrovicoccus sp. HB161399 TaxID=2720392 RepID=UPI0015579D6A|nr:polysaccharide biosynthesis/export family protein [Mangrovicoccus sp. HB161399]